MSHVYSMTGYATAHCETALGLASLELRSVNARFLDLTLRITDKLRAVEPDVRELLQTNIGRGKIECHLGLKENLASNVLAVDPKALDTLKTLQEQIQAKLGQVDPLSVIDIINYPGATTQADLDEAQLKEDILGLAKTALVAFNASREREGRALSQVLLGYCDQIEQTVLTLRPRLPEILAALQGKLAERLNTALSDTLSGTGAITREEVSERIRQEVTLYALKMDVDEEMNRLLTHVTEARRVLAGGGPVGRRLDFLMQEMNREANTLGSKAVAIEMTNVSLELKLAIEQMREQIQNLE